MDLRGIFMFLNEILPLIIVYVIAKLFRVLAVKKEGKLTVLNIFGAFISYSTSVKEFQSKGKVYYILELITIVVGMLALFIRAIFRH